MKEICGDLAAEHDALEAIVRDLDDAGLDRPTPAEGWMIRDQISHLAYFDGTARAAIVDPEAFALEVQAVQAGERDLIEEHLRIGRDADAGELMSWWRTRRSELLDALLPLDPGTRLPWYGPPMGAKSFATARLMETWAHGQDVADTLGVTVAPTDRLRHVAHIGVRARPFAYFTNSREMPDREIRVELTGPGGDVWTWGPADAADTVRGDALDFCLVVTQRRHPDDVDLDVRGEAAADWIGIAQAFAGGPGEGRQPGQFPRD
jgi:uncharacterized protein (TIGR03084 family)